jgi:hypothetical protein
VAVRINHGGTLLGFWAPETFDAFENIDDGLVCSQKRCFDGFKSGDLCALESPLLRNFEEEGVLITERPTKRLSVGDRREKLFDWYCSSTVLMYLLVAAVSGCRNAVTA